MSRVLITRKVGETVLIKGSNGEKIQMKFLEIKDKDGNKIIRCRIKADSSIIISRYKEMKEDNEDLCEVDEKIEVYPAKSEEEKE